MQSPPLPRRAFPSHHHGSLLFKACWLLESSYRPCRTAQTRRPPRPRRRFVPRTPSVVSPLIRLALIATARGEPVREAGQPEACQGSQGARARALRCWLSWKRSMWGANRRVLIPILASTALCDRYVEHSGLCGCARTDNTRLALAGFIPEGPKKLSEVRRPSRPF